MCVLSAGDHARGGCAGSGCALDAYEYSYADDQGAQPRPPPLHSLGLVHSLCKLQALEVLLHGLGLLPLVLDLESQGVTIVPLESMHTDFEFRMWAVWQANSPSLLVRQFVQLLEQRSALPTTKTPTALMSA